jgi:CBS domain-containing protein
MRVIDVMTPDVHTTTAETSIRDLAAELGRLRISGMPVVSDSGQVVGVISEADVLAKARRGPQDAGRGALERLLHRSSSNGDAKHDARVVGEAMSSPAVTIETYCSVATAAGRMLEHGVNRLPVIQRGRLVGIVTRADLVRAFARSAEEVLAEARREVEHHQQLNGDPGAVAVELHDGDIVLTGSVRRRSDAEALPRLVRTVPGVVEVRSDLRWSDDD